MAVHEVGLVLGQVESLSELRIPLVFVGLLKLQPCWLKSPLER